MFAVHTSSLSAEIDAGTEPVVIVVTGFKAGTAKENRLGHGAVATVIGENRALVIQTAHGTSVCWADGKGKEETGKT